MVKYKPIEGFDGYRVGNDGSVWTKWEQRRKPKGYGAMYALGITWRRLRCSRIRGYRVATLYRNKVQHRFKVHRLVLTHFRGPCPSGCETRHDDGDRNNNAIGNLSWGTKKQNGEDRVRHGTTLQGTKHPRAKLTPSIVTMIVVPRLHAKHSRTAIARDLSVTPQCIDSIATGKSWSHLTGVSKSK